MKLNVKKTGIVLFCIAVITLIILMVTGYISLWTEGMAAIAGNITEFTDINGETVQGEYSVSIDLNDLESNVGKELYHDGTNRIYVSSVDNCSGYRIQFRSCGQYSINYAELISGLQHATIDDSFTSNMTAKMTATYHDKTYNCSVMGLGGINYKDGDIFSFYIFPAEAYENNEVSLSESGIVTLTITDLYKNVWTKK